MNNGIKALAVAAVMLASAFCLINAFPTDADDAVVHTAEYEDDDITVSYRDYYGTTDMGLYNIEFLTSVPSDPVRISIDNGDWTSPLKLDGKKLNYADDSLLDIGTHYLVINGGNNTYVKIATLVIGTYTVQFEMNGHGTQVESQSVDEGGLVEEPVKPTASGYTFGGWYSDSGLTTKWDFDSDTVTGDMTLYAKWTSSPGPGPGPGPGTTYTVTFAVDPTVGGTVSKTSVSGLSSGTVIASSENTVTIGTGTTAQTITATAASGYSFKEWKDIPSTGTVTANVTVTAVFIEEVQPITKEVANGSVTIPASVVESAGIKDASKLILKIEKVTPTASNIPSDAICYQVTLTYDGKALTKFSDYIDVLLKLPTGILSTGLKVYYVSDDGTTVENMNATYDAGTNSMFFKTKHLSVFAITKENIEPVPVLSSISVKTAPSKVSYTVGDKFDPTGLVLSLKYDDGTSKDLAYKGNESKFSFSPDLETSLKSTDKTVTITYEGKTTTQSITVSESPSGGDDNSMMIIIIVIIVLLLIVAIAFFVMKMRIKP